MKQPIATGGSNLTLMKIFVCYSYKVVFSCAIVHKDINACSLESLVSHKFFHCTSFLVEFYRHL